MVDEMVNRGQLHLLTFATEKTWEQRHHCLRDSVTLIVCL